jgi:hypothetical protein
MEGWDQIDHRRDTRANRLLAVRALHGAEEVLLSLSKVVSCLRMEKWILSGKMRVSHVIFQWWISADKR